jgi:hypothetical protein
MRTTSLSLSSLVLLSSAIGLLLSVAAFAADTVYKWKDSSGQSHYSQSPPVGQKYETITTNGSAPASSSTSASAPGASAPAAPSSTKKVASTNVPAGLALHQKNCATARGNVATLTNNPTANLDTKGTGKPSPVSAKDRAAELARANQMVTQYCGQ